MEALNYTYHYGNYTYNDENYTYENSINESSETTNPFSNQIVGYTIAMTLTFFLVAYLTKSDCDTRAADLQRIKELENRKSCPERRKRAIVKLIETKTFTKGEWWCDEHQTSPDENCEANIILRNEENNAECPICLETFEEGQDLSRSQERRCQHTFHAECLELWLMKGDDCPCCRVTFIDALTLLEDTEEVVLMPKENMRGRGSDENV